MASTANNGSTSWVKGDPWTSVEVTDVSNLVALTFGVTDILWLKRKLYHSLDWTVDVLKTYAVPCEGKAVTVKENFHSTLEKCAVL